MKNSIKIISCSLLILFFTSCSTKTSLTYDPIIQEQPKNDICVSVDSFQDTRSKPQEIGALRNGYGMPLVKITTDDDVPMWMKVALEKELINAGYLITDKDNENVYHIKGKIIKVVSGTYFTYYGKIAIEMSLNKGEIVLLEKTYLSKENMGMCWQLSPLINRTKQAIKCSNALEFNLQEIYRQFIENINQELL
ncbi:MAG: hypothetical protein KBC64_07710 [Simkaniaceae bacterium]|nr:hypothetical protein [Simkaniaceae bacterium]